MRIAITKQAPYLKHASYALFAAGTVGDVWSEDELSVESEAKEKINKNKRVKLDS